MLIKIIYDSERYGDIPRNQVRINNRIFTKKVPISLLREFRFQISFAKISLKTLIVIKNETIQAILSQENKGDIFQHRDRLNNLFFFKERKQLHKTARESSLTIDEVLIYARNDF